MTDKYSKRYLIYALVSFGCLLASVLVLSKDYILGYILFVVSAALMGAAFNEIQLIKKEFKDFKNVPYVLGTFVIACTIGTFSIMSDEVRNLFPSSLT